MLNRPKFKDCFHLEVLEPHTIFLLTEDTHWALSGPIYKQLAPLLDGQHTFGDILMALDGNFSMMEIHHALNQMIAKGYIVEADDSVPPEKAAFWHSLGVDTKTALTRLAQTMVTVTAVGEGDPDLLLSTLEQQGVCLGEQGDLTVVVTDDYLQLGLDEINQTALATGKPWMLVKLIGNTAWVGPIFVPGKTGCYACLAQRLHTNRQLESFLLRRKGSDTPLKISLSALPTTLHAAANLAATEIVKYVVQGHNPQLEGQLITFNMLAAETQKHILTRRPQCPVCGHPEDYQAVQPIQLKSSKKKFVNDGGHRSAYPEETFIRNQHHISPITGIVTFLVDITGDVNGLAYSYIAGHNFAMVQDTLYWLYTNLRSRTGGKGMTDIQAKVSAISEAVERYSGVYRGDEPATRGSYRSLAPQAIHLYQSLHFSEKQYAERDSWNAQLTGGRFHVIPNRFNEDQALDWTSVWSLTNEEFRYALTSFCYFGHPEANRFFFCAGDSNGTSAGNTLEEAILQAFLELVERDSVAIWWYNRIQRPKVDIKSFGLPYLEALGVYYQSLAREFWVIDITADLGIPCFAAVSRRLDRPVEDLIIGFGAHLDPKIALLRAITELNQFLPAVTGVNPDGTTRYNFPDGEATVWWKSASLANQPYLVANPNLPSKTAGDYPILYSEDLKDDVQTCVEIARQAGLEVFALDQTRPDIGLNVCRVIVPGLRHFWRRLGPGRLYDVPVQLGWLEQPTPEEEMNPFSIFF